MILINLFSACIHADTYSANTSIVLSYQIEPSYKVKIPKEIDITDREVTFYYYVLGDIYADQFLNVSFDCEVILNSINNSFKAYVSQEKEYFSSLELSNDYSSYLAYIRHDDIKAGNYTGNLNMVISLIGGNDAN